MRKKLISDEYIRLNHQLHKINPIFGDAGHRWSIRALELLKKTDSNSFLDYGCGKGTIKFENGVDVQLYDPCIPERSNLPSPAGIVFCTDVLEHIEEDYIDNVLDHLKELSQKGFFCIVALRPSNKTLPDGRNTHILLKSREWWIRQLKKRFHGGKQLNHRNRNKIYFQWIKN
jgi:2-polyprenyl-3-methyl-5-hydroxy-6-metoxy-1,4-benzoquinol methylase